MKYLTCSIDILDASIRSVVLGGVTKYLRLSILSTTALLSEFILQRLSRSGFKQASKSRLTSSESSLLSESLFLIISIGRFTSVGTGLVTTGRGSYSSSGSLTLSSLKSTGRPAASNCFFSTALSIFSTLSGVITRSLSDLGAKMDFSASRL